MHRETMWLGIIGIAILIVFTILWLMGGSWRPVAMAVLIVGYTAIVAYWPRSKSRGEE